MSLLIFIVILGILVIVHEFGHFIASKKIGVRVEQFSIGFGPRLFKKDYKGTQYSFSAIPFGGYVKLSGDNIEEYKGSKDEYFSKPAGKRFWILFGGPFLNYLLGFIIFWGIFVSGFPTMGTRVGSVLEGYGAKDAGIEKGDRIVAIDSQKVSLWEDLQKQVYARQDSEIVNVSLMRDNQRLSLDVHIRQKQLDDALGGKRRVGLLGISPDYKDITVMRYGPAKSLLLAAQKTWDLTLLTYQGLWRIVSGQLSMKESMTGPLGIFYITSQTASLGIVALVHLVALLSISLALFNLLPFPALDGGHIALLLVEKIRGKALSLRMDKVVNQVGFTFIIALAVLVTYNDIVRFFGDKIGGMFR